MDRVVFVCLYAGYRRGGQGRCVRTQADRQTAPGIYKGIG